MLWTVKHPDSSTTIKKKFQLIIDRNAVNRTCDHHIAHVQTSLNAARKYVLDNLCTLLMFVKQANDAVLHII